MKNEIILYQSNELPQHIEVRIDEDNETFWLSLNQIAQLFERDKSVISRHLKNIFNDHELDKDSVVAFFATTASDGKTYHVEHFNLDAILSVGYRVNSKRGTQFRIWANQVLKDFLMKGYAINNRMNRLEEKIEKIDSKVNAINLQLITKELPTQGVFFNGQIFDAYELTSRIIRSAKKEIILIDNYIDESTITHLSKKAEKVNVFLLTKTISRQLALDVDKANAQYGHFEIKEFKDSHDRFLIIDQKELYHLGASLKDLGKKPVVSEAEPWFAFSRMDSLTEVVLNQLKMEVV